MSSNLGDKNEPATTIGLEEKAAHGAGSRVDLREIARKRKQSRGPYSDYAQAHPVVHTFFIICIFIPFVVCSMAFTFGCVLAAMENWSVVDGFYYVMGNLAGLATPLTEVMPEDDFGKAVDILIAVWSLSVAGACIGIISQLQVVARFTKGLEVFGVRGDFTVEQQERMLKMFNEIDSLTFDQFCKVMTELNWISLDKDGNFGDLKELFDLFDRNGNGLLDRREIELLVLQIMSSNDNIELASGQERLMREAKNSVEEDITKEQMRKMAMEIELLKHSIRKIEMAVCGNVDDEPAIRRPEVTTVVNDVSMTLSSSAPVSTIGGPAPGGPLEPYDTTQRACMLY